MATDSDPQINASHLDSVVKNAVNKELAAKGYTLDTTGQPTFLTTYHAVISKQVMTVSLNNQADERIADYTGCSKDSIPRMEEITYDQGTLVLDFCSANNPSIYWRGSAKAKVHLTDSQTKNDERVSQAVKEIMKPFPDR